MPQGAWIEPDNQETGQSAPPPYGGEYSPPPVAPARTRSRHARLIVALCGVLIVGLLATQVTLEVKAMLRQFHKAVLSLPSPTPSPIPTAPPSSPAAVPHTLTIPRTFAGYVRVTNDLADRTAAQLRKEAKREDAEAGRMIAKAKIAVYGKKGESQPALLFVGLSGAVDPSVAEELRSMSPSEAADSFLDVPHSRAYPAGPFGGVLRCARDKSGSQAVSACVWADRSVIGMVIGPLISNPKELAAVALRLRGAAEH